MRTDVLSCMFSTGYPRLCVLRFKYLATLTRRTTITTVGTGLPNHCLHQAYWFYFLNHSISSLLCCVLVHICLKILTEDFLYFLSSISSVRLSLSCVYAFCTLCLFSFHHGDHAHALLCLLLSTYSAASSSSVRNFPHPEIPL